MVRTFNFNFGKDMKKTLKRQDGQDGFTLLELLVVVAILATIGGAVIGTFGNQEENAAQGTATNSIAALENSLRVYQATQGQLPNDLETLACRPYNNAGVAVALATTDIVNGPSISNGTTNDAAKAYKLGGSSDLNGLGGGLGKKLADKFDLLPIADVEGLTDAGVTTVRYAATLACDELDNPVNMSNQYSGTNIFATVKGALSGTTIPNHIFESARTSNESKSKNRGRGFSHTLVNGDPLMVWTRGHGSYNNLKVGAGATDVLVGLGIGQASTLVGTNAEAMLAKAPFYGQIAKDKYAHYVALVKIGTDTDGDLFGATDFKASKATVVALVDARGDFLDEEIAEFTDQKQ